MHTVEQVLGLLRASVGALPAEEVPLAICAGRMLARAVCMDRDAPPFDRAMRDGYAVRAEDAAVGAKLNIIGRQDAGMDGGLAVGPGTCVAINTGAALPAGADAVVMVEDTRGGPSGGDARGRALDQGVVELLKGAEMGLNIQRRASDAAAGEEVLGSGVRMTPAAAAVAASAGAGRVWVHRQARVAVLTTGDEVVAVDHTPRPMQIRNSNGPMLCALGRAAGAEVEDLGVAPDDREMLRTAMRRGLDAADVLVVTGGMSMGTKDLVPEVLAEEGAEILVQTVKMKPGKPFLFGRLGHKWVVGLPGNPVSGFVCFVRFVGPMLRVMMGGRFDVELERAVSDEALEANGGREFYQPGVARMEGGVLRVRGLAWRGSADIFTLAKANVLMVHEAGAPARGAGAFVEVLRVPE